MRFGRRARAMLKFESAAADGRPDGRADRPTGGADTCALRANARDRLAAGARWTRFERPTRAGNAGRRSESAGPVAGRQVTMTTEFL